MMEQMPGARLFSRRVRQSSTSRLVTGSVCESASGGETGTHNSIPQRGKRLRQVSNFNFH